MDEEYNNNNNYEYEGNHQNTGDFDSFDDAEEEEEEDEYEDDDDDDDLKCHSAPISPTRLLDLDSDDSSSSLSSQNKQDKIMTNEKRTSINMTKNRSKVADKSSFVYDMNLYTEQNFLILNEREEFEKELRMRKKRNKNQPIKNNRDLLSSSESIEKLVQCKLEPLVIEEDGGNNAFNNNNNQNNVQKTEDKESSSTSSSSFSVSSSSSSSAVNSPDSAINTNNPCNETQQKDPLDNKETDTESIEDNEPQAPMANITESLSETVNKETKVISNNNININNNELDADEISSSSTLALSESQYHLKETYEKAKRERELEQEQAELEKKRLQEILDICMEFQRQEQLKAASAQTLPNKTPVKPLNNPNMGSLLKQTVNMNG